MNASPLKPAALFSDHMVVQRDRPFRVWGTASPGEKLELTLAGSSATTLADHGGRWSAELPACGAGGPFALAIVGETTHIINDVMVGEVWFCSGQSNMHWTMSPDHGVVDNEAELAAANFSDIRILTVLAAPSSVPLRDVEGTWLPVSPKNLCIGGPNGASAVAYFFGRELHRQLGVPVGLIQSSLGSTPIESWSAGGELYHGMVAPLGGFCVRGVIWYQGEANCLARDGLEYGAKQAKLIEQWRGLWGNCDMPFYFAQLAPYRYSNHCAIDAYELPLIWEAQRAILAISHTGMAVTTDLVDDLDDCHPRNKQLVGERLARWALNRDYDKLEVVCSGPLYNRMTIEQDKVRLHFDFAGGGLATRDNQPPSWFEIADASGCFEPAVARIDGQTVVVSARGIRAPKAVRMGWSEIAQPNLVNKEGLPASPFRAGC